MKVYQGNGSEYSLQDSKEDIVLPSYWRAPMDNAVTKIRNIRKNHADSVFEYVFITDTHWVGNVKNSPMLIRYLLNKIGNVPVIFGGDAIKTTNDTLEGAEKELEDFLDAFSAYDILPICAWGNHDNNSEHNANNIIGNSRLYDLLYREQESVSVNYAGTSISYIDNPSQKVRLFTFHCNTAKTGSKMSDELFGKMNEIIAELSGDWTVVIISHAGLRSDLSYNISTSYIKDFMKHQASVCMWHCGHIHTDKNSTLTEGEKTIAAAATTCDSARETDETSPKMTIGTATEQAFDFVQVDTKNKKIYMTRIGAGSDRELSYV